MREAQFLKQNAEKWKQYEQELNIVIPTDTLAGRFVELTDDLAYARTFYPKSNTEKYLNGLAALFHQKIYRNKKEKKNRIFWFWQYELPFLFKRYQKQFLYAAALFVLFALMGALSAKYDDNFVRLILGDDYVNMTAENIDKGDPFGVYKQSGSLLMFLGIAVNNIQVSFWGYVLGITLSLGTVWLLLSNGLMMGSFQYYFISKGLGAKFILVVFIHGTLELWSIIIAGAAGMILGNSILFPGTYTRMQSFLRGGKDGLKIVLGLIPMFITAAFFEGFVTRYTEMPLVVSISILAASLLFIVWYFIIYPTRLHKRIAGVTAGEQTGNQNFNAWINKKFSLES
ncbi:stage II sporulation protein M [Panacibacter sp. DH6]|uniref:Stage II sporulation protein M n=1 Tax=Panacibacter microcysteis TaxID=2793269 RepID=A0A931GZ29_9BACT|nr:stage II sporulation protein M [Panacibacter microcysteis]MBG9377973.1 stage II sporulation protein M [Panacibacter microcysteis]